MQVSRVGLLAFCALFLLTPLACQPPAPPAVDQTATNLTTEGAAIRQALHAYIDRSPSPKPLDLEVAQIGVDSGYALVTWMHEKQAGQAVLRKQQGAWNVVDCGEGWLGLRGVCAEQVPADVARRLLDQVDPKWSNYEVP